MVHQKTPYRLLAVADAKARPRRRASLRQERAGLNVCDAGVIERGKTNPCLRGKGKVEENHTMTKKRTTIQELLSARQTTRETAHEARRVAKDADRAARDANAAWQRVLSARESGTGEDTAWKEFFTARDRAANAENACEKETEISAFFERVFEVKSTAKRRRNPKIESIVEKLGISDFHTSEDAAYFKDAEIGKVRLAGHERRRGQLANYTFEATDAEILFLRMEDVMEVAEEMKRSRSIHKPDAVVVYDINASSKDIALSLEEALTSLRAAALLEEEDEDEDTKN